MAKIQNSDIIQRLIELAKLDASREIMPSQLSNIVIPTLSLNPHSLFRYRLIFDTSSSFNKSFIVPSGKKWRILYGLVRGVTSASVGARTLRINVTPGLVDTEQLWNSDAANTQVENTTELYNFASGYGDVTETIPNKHFMPIPSEFILLENMRLQFLYSNGFSGDVLNVRFIVEESDLLPIEK